MVTIIPIDIDENFIRNGLAAAVATRLESRLRALSEVVAELRASSIIDRSEWERVVAEFGATVETMRPIMEYARCFDDQWPTDEENGEENGEEGDDDAT